MLGIHRSPVNSPHKGQWRGASMFSLICARINGWVNNGEAGDLRRYRAYYDVSVMGHGICANSPISQILPHQTYPTMQHFVFCILPCCLISYICPITYMAIKEGINTRRSNIYPVNDKWIEADAKYTTWWLTGCHCWYCGCNIYINHAPRLTNELATWVQWCMYGGNVGGHVQLGWQYCPLMTDRQRLTHRGQVMHTYICVSELGQHCFRKWLDACTASSHYLNQCWLVYWNYGNKLQWILNHDKTIFIHENAFENVCKMAAKWVVIYGL